MVKGAAIVLLVVLCCAYAAPSTQPNDSETALTVPNPQPAEKVIQPTINNITTQQQQQQQQQTPTEPTNRLAPALADLLSIESHQSPPNILIAVVSSPAHSRARRSIRETWGKDAHTHGIAVKFFVGVIPSQVSITDGDLAAEGEDMVRLTDFVESYHNLTSKAIDIFEYGWRNGFDGVFKADDDTYIRIPKLLSFLSQHPNLETLYAGQFIRGNTVGRTPNTRWYAYDQYPVDRYPPYTNGPGMFLGLRGIKYIGESKDKLNRIRVDDAAVGVWMNDIGGMNQVDMPSCSFSFYPSTGSIWVGPMNAVEMRDIHQGKSFTPAVCFDAEYGCLCHGNPALSGEEVGACWHRLSESEYTDYIPRHHMC